MTTATDTADARAFLDKIAAEPADDTGRLVFADWCDENDDPARAEFIRVQCELAASGLTACRRQIAPGPGAAGNPHRVDCRRCDFCVPAYRARELRTANEAVWRRGPVCRMCLGGGYVPTDRDDSTCEVCDGTGDLGGLMDCSRHEYTVAGRPQQGEITGWRHAVEFRRGFPDEVRCELGECVEEERCDVCGGRGTEPAIEGGEATCVFCHGSRRRYRVTDWARRVVRHHPVRGFRVTDREPFGTLVTLPYGWQKRSVFDEFWPGRDGENGYRYAIPDVAFSLLAGGKLTNRGLQIHYPTPEAAHDALACALALLALLARKEAATT